MAGKEQIIPKKNASRRDAWEEKVRSIYNHQTPKNQEITQIPPEHKKSSTPACRAAAQAGISRIDTKDNDSRAPLWREIILSRRDRC